MINLKQLLTNNKTKSTKERIVRLLASSGSLSSLQISQQLQLAKSSVSSAVKQLRLAGIIIPAMTPKNFVSSGVGRPQTHLTLNPRGGVCIGVQLLTDSVRIVVVDVAHNILAHDQRHIGKQYNVDSALSALQDMIQAYCQQANLQADEVLGLGVAFPGPICPVSKQVVQSVVLPQWQDVDVAKEIQQQLGFDSVVANESNCSALAELIWGAAQDQDTFVFVKIDLGVGGAIVIDGRVYEGVNGGAGEFGHVSIDAHGDLCRCGTRGCVELTGSLIPVLAAATQILGRHLSVAEFIELVVSGEPRCVRLVEEMASATGLAIAQITTAINPPLVVIGGRAAALGQPLFDTLRRVSSQNTMLKQTTATSGANSIIVPGLFAGEDSSLGAVGLFLRDHL